MPKNDPYSRPINATKPEHVRAMDYYGTPVEDRKPVGLAGNPNAARVRALPSVVPQWPKPTPNPEPTTLNTDATSPSDDESAPLISEISDAVTEDDLFG